MEKINIVELLKDCPSGMELDCAIYENVTLIEVKEGYDYPIVIETPNGQMLFSKYGCFSKNEFAKCVIFPKGKTTWEGFVPPFKFKDGDIVATNDGYFIGIIKVKDNKQVNTYCAIDYREYFRINVDYTFNRLATEKEKEKLFQAIKDSGHRWDEETKTLEPLIEPKFKVGDKIVKKNGVCVPFVITGVSDDYYSSKTENSVEILPVVDQDNWELVPNKFDVTTLKPFDKVLVRDYDYQCWMVSFFGYCDKFMGKFYIVRGVCIQCIPYEGNEHLLGTTNDCEDFYKNW